ncbi:unnamed protein product [Acanthoscelides obtectus]|uniref:Uncharacterized protein n=1 Tax=Acanthoscelides obtectus TaxID=200917 RepID=A0A9P0MI71_ACAOB|nr:unnamed protein product [Acanthoscelides obtectus]CAK1622364.1 hypothetical protein AOBTE_LOCUS1444 [Acanthoscelides obtectus]
MKFLRILTDTPEKEAIEAEATARKIKKVVPLKHDDLLSTTNKQQSRQKHATPPQSSSNDEEEESELGGSSEDISDVESYEREMLQIKALEDVKTLQVGDFVLVKFCTKTSTMHYVGLVISKEDVEYEKIRKSHSNSYIHIQVDSQVEENTNTHDNLLLDVRNKLATELAKNEGLSSAIMSLNCKIEKLTQKLKYKDKTIEQREGIINNVKCKTVVTDRYVQTDPSSRNSIHVQTQAVTSNSTQTQTQLTPIKNQPKRDKNHLDCIKANPTEANTTEDKRCKLLILADEQGRNLIHILRGVLPLDQFAVTSMLHPNSQLNNIIKDARKLTTDFTKSDYVLIMDGSNDALTKGFIQCEPLRETLKVLKATNVIIAAVPK